MPHVLLGWYQAAFPLLQPGYEAMNLWQCENRYKVESHTCNFCGQDVVREHYASDRKLPSTKVQ